jgi:hypothetical protein
MDRKAEGKPAPAVRKACRHHAEYTRATKRGLTHQSRLRPRVVSVPATRSRERLYPGKARTISTIAAKCSSAPTIVSAWKTSW